MNYYLLQQKHFHDTTYKHNLGKVISHDGHCNHHRMNITVNRGFYDSSWTTVTINRLTITVAVFLKHPPHKATASCKCSTVSVFVTCAPWLNIFIIKKDISMSVLNLSLKLNLNFVRLLKYIRSRKHAHGRRRGRWKDQQVHLLGTCAHNTCKDVLALTLVLCFFYEYSVA